MRSTAPAVVTFLVGALFIVVGVYGYAYMGRFIDSARETTATVVSVAHESVMKKGRMHPVVRFTTSDGREVTASSDQHHNVQVGERVQVLYDPAHPQDIEITTLAQAQRRRLLFSGLAVFVGVVVCAGAIGFDPRKMVSRS